MSQQNKICRFTSCHCGQPRLRFAFLKPYRWPRQLFTASTSRSRKRSEEVWLSRETEERKISRLKEKIPGKIFLRLGSDCQKNACFLRSLIIRSKKISRGTWHSQICGNFSCFTAFRMFFFHQSHVPCTSISYVLKNVTLNSKISRKIKF